MLDEDGHPIAVAYYAPATATDGTWYLTMIAVHPSEQGRGTALLGHVESTLQDDGQRLLLVETSGFAPAWSWSAVSAHPSSASCGGGVGEVAG